MIDGLIALRISSAEKRRRFKRPKSNKLNSTSIRIKTEKYDFSHNLPICHVWVEAMCVMKTFIIQYFISIEWLRSYSASTIALAPPPSTRERVISLFEHIYVYSLCRFLLPSWLGYVIEPKKNESYSNCSEVEWNPRSCWKWIAFILMNNKIAKVDHVVRQTKTQHSIRISCKIIKWLFATVKTEKLQSKYPHIMLAQRTTVLVPKNILKMESANRRASPRAVMLHELLTCWYVCVRARVWLSEPI